MVCAQKVSTWAAFERKSYPKAVDIPAPCAKYSWARKPLLRKSFVGWIFFASGLNFAEAAASRSAPCAHTTHPTRDPTNPFRHSSRPCFWRSQPGCTQKIIPSAETATQAGAWWCMDCADVTHAFCVWCSRSNTHKKTPIKTTFMLYFCTPVSQLPIYLTPTIYRAKVSASAQYNGVHTMGRGNMGIAISLEGSGLPVCASARIFLRLEFVRFMLQLAWTDTLQNGAKISHVNCRYWFLWHGSQWRWEMQK